MPRQVAVASPVGDAPPIRAPRVLLLTASMGAGHTGVARELARRLRMRGCEADVVDLLTILPRPLGLGLRAFYAAMLRWAPWLYEIIYQAWFNSRRARATPISPITWFGNRAVQKVVRDRKPAAIVSTFHLCSRIVGGQRRAGRLALPTATVIADFAVHNLWVDPAVDLHVCFHPAVARAAEARGAAVATAPGPVVETRFVETRWDRQSVRESLGLRGDERAVLIVAGSWGTGDVDAAVGAIAKAPGLTPIVICGRDEKLRARLTWCLRGTASRVLGWVEDMDRLIVAADVVIENAGGLTCMEALAAKRPVVSFKPIPGHGRANVEAMARCGIVTHVRRASDLVAAVERAARSGPNREPGVAAAAEMFCRDAAEDILTALIGSPAPKLATSDNRRPGDQKDSNRHDYEAE